VLAVFVVVGIGALGTVVVSFLVSAVASSLVGDGSLLIRLLLVVFAVGPCLSIGDRCGRWWAFIGSVALVPMLGFGVLVAGRGSSSDLAFLLLAVLMTAFALAAGSLQRALATQVSQRRRPPLAGADAPQRQRAPQQQPMPSAASSRERLRAH
jgi:hypothetical protein